MVSTPTRADPAIASLLDGADALSVDLDGTLAETGALKPRMWVEWIRAPRVVLGWPAIVEAHRAARHPDLRAACVRALATSLRREPGEVDRVVARAIDRRWPTLYRFAQRPRGVWALVRAARARGMPVVVVSDYPGLDKLDAMGEPFDLVVDCRALGALKPHPDGVIAAAALAGVPPSRLLHVGDRWDTDGLAAAAAGARFVHLDDLDAPRLRPAE